MIVRIPKVRGSLKRDPRMILRGARNRLIVLDMKYQRVTRPKRKALLGRKLARCVARIETLERMINEDDYWIGPM